MKVLLCGTSLLPEYGGPSISVSSLAVALADAGVEVGLWAADQSADASPLVPGASSVRRLKGRVSDAFANFGKPDVIHDNGIWLLHNHRLAILAAANNVPRVVSTRGMLEPWAMNHKYWKKRIAWLLYQRRELQLAQWLHATAELEAHNVDRLNIGVPICIIPNGVAIPHLDPHLRRVRHAARTALFIGRIYPVKGLPMLVQAWARVRPTGWRLEIAGPDEAGHRSVVESVVAGTKLQDVISFIGPVSDESKLAAFRTADLVVLPSYSESFGIVVAEALAHGVPVLTTSGTPWSGLRERGCGWCVDATIDGIVDGLRLATSQETDVLRKMGAVGRRWMTEEFGWEQVAKKFLAKYESVLTSAL